MLSDALILIALVWFFGGVLYRERANLKAATFRANHYNDFVKAMEIEFGEFKVAAAAKKHNLPLYSESAVQRSNLAVRLGW